MHIPYIKFHDSISNRSRPHAKRNGQTDGQTDPNQYDPFGGIKIRVRLFVIRFVMLIPNIKISRAYL